MTDCAVVSQPVNASRLQSLSPWPAWLLAPRNAAKTAPALARVREDASRDLDEMLLATAAGDSRAFERLYRLSSAALYAQIRRTVWQRSEAEEVLQEAYVKVWRHAASFDPRQAVAMTWMARIARNQAIDHLRRSNARAQHESVLDDDDGDDALRHDAEQLADPAALPQGLLEQRQMSHRIDLLLARLSAGQRQVLVLAFREGLSHAEIAAQLGAPLGTVKSWMRRGLQSLQAVLAGEQQTAAAVLGRHAALAMR